MTDKSMLQPTWGAWYWTVWTLVLLGTLMVPEVYALFTNWRNTLSDWVWRAFSMAPGQQLPWTAAHYLAFGAWLTVMSWLTWHFFFRRFT